MRQLDHNEARDGWRLMQIPLCRATINGESMASCQKRFTSLSLCFDSWDAALAAILDRRPGVRVRSQCCPLGNEFEQHDCDRRASSRDQNGCHKNRTISLGVCLAANAANQHHEVSIRRK